MLLDEERQGSCLYSTLYGFRSSVVRCFGKDPFNIRNMPFIATDDAKRAFRDSIINSKQPDTAAHPYVYSKISTVDIIRDQNPVKELSRLGYFGRGPGSITERSIKRGYLFPASIALEFHYIDSDLERTLHFIEQFLLISCTGGFSFTVLYDDSFEWVGNVEVESSVSITEAILEDSAMPGEMDIYMTVNIATKLGFAKSTYRVNERAPSVEIFTARMAK